jgi:hypothetical protein
MKENPLNIVDDDWAAIVRAHFKTAAAVKTPPADGTLVSGVVIANAPFGIYLDLGCGKPALLEVIYAPMRPDDATFPHWTKQHGASLLVKVSHVDNDIVHVYQWDDYETWKPPAE